jgi:hypothetical protein
MIQHWTGLGSVERFGGQESRKGTRVLGILLGGGVRGRGVELCRPLSETKGTLPADVGS